MTVRVVENRVVEILFYSIWVLATVTLGVSGGLLIHATWDDLSTNIKKCISPSSSNLVQSIENLTLSASDVTNVSALEPFMIATVSKLIVKDDNQGSILKTIENELIKDVVEFIGSKINLDKFDAFVLYVNNTLNALIDQVQSIKQNLLEVIRYIVITQLVILILCVVFTFLHVILIAISSKYRLGVHGVACEESSNRSLSLSVVIRYFILITTTITGTIAALMFLIERYGLKEVPLMDPIITCSLVSHLETYGLFASITAAAVLLITFLEPIGINGVTLRKESYVILDIPEPHTLGYVDDEL